MGGNRSLSLSRRDRRWTTRRPELLEAVDDEHDPARAVAAVAVLGHQLPAELGNLAVQLADRAGPV